MLKNTLKVLKLSPVKVFREMFPEKEGKLINQLAYQYFQRDFGGLTQDEVRLFESGIEKAKVKAQQNAEAKAKSEAEKKVRAEKDAIKRAAKDSKKQALNTWVDSLSITPPLGYSEDETAKEILEKFSAFKVIAKNKIARKRKKSLTKTKTKTK